MPKNIIITGKPESGKSTLLESLVGTFQNKTGFLTKEIRESGARVGFEIRPSKGSSVILAHVDFNEPHRVGKYGVKIEALESMLKECSMFDKGDILYVDEIGQMQLHSDGFKRSVSSFLDSENVCVCTMSAVYDHEYIRKLKDREDVVIVEITEGNREGHRSDICQLIESLKTNLV